MSCHIQPVMKYCLVFVEEILELGTSGNDHSDYSLTSHRTNSCHIQPVMRYCLVFAEEILINVAILLESKTSARYELYILIN